MAKNIFTPDFYKAVYKAICEYCEKNYESNGESSDTMSGSFSYKEYEIEFEADIEGEWHDESFDHAFGTWHDPNPCYVFGRVSGISDLIVYDESGPIDGVDADKLYEAFQESEHKGHKTGDIVNIFVDGRWSQDTFELAYYDGMIEMYVVKADRPVCGSNLRAVMAVRNAGD